jgi:hypothetical protein
MILWLRIVRTGVPTAGRTVQYASLFTMYSYVVNSVVYCSSYVVYSAVYCSSVLEKLRRYLLFGATTRNRLNIELDLTKVIWVPFAQLYSLAETPHPPPPRIWAHIRGRYWSAKIDDISLLSPELHSHQSS